MGVRIAKDVGRLGRRWGCGRAGVGIHRPADVLFLLKLPGWPTGHGGHEFRVYKQ